jgi:phosphoglucomutase
MRGQQEIAEMMQSYRDNPPTHINNSPVLELLDYQTQQGKNLKSGETWKIELPKSNVLQFKLQDGTKISARPSGTEPKIKFYFSVHDHLENKQKFDEMLAAHKQKIQDVISDMKLK